MLCLGLRYQDVYFILKAEIWISKRILHIECRSCFYIIANIFSEFNNILVYVYNKKLQMYLYNKYSVKKLTYILSTMFFISFLEYLTYIRSSYYVNCQNIQWTESMKIQYCGKFYRNIPMCCIFWCSYKHNICLKFVQYNVFIIHEIFYKFGIGVSLFYPLHLWFYALQIQNIYAYTSI